MRTGLRAIAGALAAAFCAALAQAAPLHRYAVQIDESLEHLTVMACFDGAVPQTLTADDGASRFLQAMRIDAAPKSSIVVQANEATIVGAPHDACVNYSVQLQPRVRGRQTGGPETRRIGNDLLTAIGDWLWRPSVLADGEDIELTFDLPPTVAVSAPWPRVSDIGNWGYRLAGTPADWPGVVAFGHFQPVAIDVPGVRVELAILGEADSGQREFARGWIERTVRGVAAGYGQFPVPALQVIVASSDQRGRSPVPWAYVARGGGAAVHLFVDLSRGPEDIERDWSFTHELSHLFLPYMESRDAWLFEGLPTYLQNVLMARNGTISEEEAWRRMYEGFGRGTDVGEGLSLQDVSQRMGRGGLYLRAYWGGAAYMLAADMRLRSRKDAARSLDRALANLARCCSGTMRRYTAQEIIALLDQASGTTVFSELAAELIERPEFPDYERLFRDLDIEMLGGFPILNDGPGAEMRRGIMGKNRPEARGPRQNQGKTRTGWPRDREQSVALGQ